MSIRVLTNSEAKAHRRCSREHHNAYELGFRSAGEDAAALRFGTLIHRALEAWWRAPRGLGIAGTLRLSHALATLPPDTDAFDRARAVEMLRGYDLRWCDEPLETIGVELEFRAPLINPATGHESRTFVLGGKIDALALHRYENRIYIVEHKTSSDDLSPGSDYWQVLQVDTQVSTYYAGARALGFEPAGVIYDVLGKPKQRPLQANKSRDQPESAADYQARIREAIASNPDRYYVRGTVVRLESEELDAQWDTWQVARLIRESELAKRWPRNPESCRRFGRMCSYFPVCSGTASLEDPARYRRALNVHEELTPGWP